MVQPGYDARKRVRAGVSIMATKRVRRRSELQALQDISDSSFEQGAKQMRSLCKVAVRKVLDQQRSGATIEAIDREIDAIATTPEPSHD